MKTKELIRILQELDPSGEVEVNAGGGDIYSAETLPAYWDGALNVLIRDPSKSPYYDVIGMEEIRGGDKIRLNIMSLDDVIFDDEDDKGIYKGSENFQKMVEHYRNQRENITRNSDLSLFTDFCHSEFSLDKDSQEIKWFFNTYEKTIRSARKGPTGESKSVKDSMFEKWRSSIYLKDNILWIKTNVP